jgi:hypothetical protein
MSESGDGCAANLKVFARRVILGNVRHRLIAPRLFKRARACDCRLPGNLGSTSRLCNFTPPLLGLAAGFQQSLAF